MAERTSLHAILCVAGGSVLTCRRSVCFEFISPGLRYACRSNLRGGMRLRYIPPFEYGVGLQRPLAAVKPAAPFPVRPAFLSWRGGDQDPSVLDSPAPPTILTKAKDVGLGHVRHLDVKKCFSRYNAVWFGRSQGYSEEHRSRSGWSCGVILHVFQ